MENLKRISYEEGIRLFKEADILELGAMADNIRKKLPPENIVSFVIDRNIN